jgi:hypothetical protein
VTGLRAKVNAAMETAKHQQSAAEGALAHLAVARKAGVTIANQGPPRAESIVLTDAIIYRQVGSEIGRLPPEVIRRVVMFYALALDTARVAAMGKSFIESTETIRDLMPRARMNGGLLIAVLDKLKKAEFDATAGLKVSAEEARELAGRFGYRSTQC